MSQGNLDKCEPNFTPLLDLVLQLVMFFMLCANFVLEQTTVQVKLPKAIAAKALEKGEDYVIYLNVDKEGKVILPPSQQYVGTDGKMTESFDNAKQLEVYLVARAKEDIAAAGPANKDKPLRSLIVLRADKSCPFEKTYPIMQACRAAGYLRVQLRVELAAEK
jgi:biopolymer transport protein ExbD